MTSEERILAYLDGNLSEKESAELLHQLSVSPENRVVLEQHIKLNEFTRLGQKPFAVPEDVEASLSKRLPIILTGSEFATSTSMQTITKSGSLLMLLRRYPVRFALGGLLLLLSAGSAYRFLSPSENHDGQSVATATNSSSVASQSQTPSASSATKNTNSSNTASSSNASSSGSGNATIPSTTANNSGSTTNSTTALTDVSHRQSSSHSSSATRNHEQHNSGDRQLVKNSSGNSATTNSHAVKNSVSKNGAATHTDSRDIANNTSSSKAALPPAQTTVVPAEEHLTVVPQASLLADNSSAAVPIQPVADAKNRRSLNTLETLRNPQRSDFSVRAAGSIMGAFINVPSGNNSFTARSEYGFSAGFNYHVSPEVIFGVELGRSSIMVVSPQTTVETSLSDQLNRVVAHTYTTTVSAIYTLGAFRYTLFPYNATHVELSAEGGALLTPSLSGMIGFQALICNTLTDALEFQGGLAATGVWSTNTATAIATPNVTGPTIYKTESIPANKIFSPTIIAKAGLQYRF